MKSFRILQTWVAAIALLGSACSDSGQATPAGTGGTTAPASGGIATGGVTAATGGVTAATGGVTAATGGVTAATGGVTRTGGITRTGGVTDPVATGGVPDGTGGTVVTTGGRMGRDAGADVSGPGTGGMAVGTGGTVAATGGTATATGGAAAGDSHTPGNAPVPSPGCGKTPNLKNGTQSITAASLNRQYIIDIPADYKNDKPYKLIFGLHWMGGSMTDVATGQTVTKDVWAYFGLKRLDTPRSAIFVAPQGIDNGWADTNGRDLALIDEMVKAISNDLCIDMSRIFAGGFSYGGMMSSKLACQRSNVFRALAPQNGSGSCSTLKPVAFFASGSNDGTVNSLQTYARAIAKTNGCANSNQTIPLPAAGSKLHTCTSFDGCPAAYPVRFCAFDAGHKAAPCDGCGPEQDNGNTTWTPGEVWKFYTQF